MPGTLVGAARTVTALDYLDEVKAAGRAQIQEQMRKDLSALFRVAAAARQGFPSPTRSDAEAARFIYDALIAEAYLLENGTPRYTAYTNMAVLDRYLGSDEQLPAKEKWRRARRAIAILLSEWLELEESRLSLHGNEKLKGIKGYTDQQRVEHLHERVNALSALFESLAVHDVPDTRIIRSALGRYETDWHYFAASPDAQVAHFTCLPQTTWHDEIMFLRMIHLTESALGGIVASLEVMPVAVDGRDWVAAAELLKETLFFSDFLIRCWSVFETMPVDHFYNGFRKATGNSSAIQSLRYQRMDVLTRGLGESKRTALREQLEAAPYASWAPPIEAGLGGAVEIARAENTAEAAEFVRAAEALDRDLYKWRARHLGIARKYLPEHAVGTGNEGVEYLANSSRYPRVVASEAAARDTEPVDPTSVAPPPARATATYRMHADAAPLAVVVGTNFEAVDLGEAIGELYDALASVPERIVVRHFENYQRYFKAHNFPLPRQWSNYQRQRTAPSNPAAAILLAAEFSSGMLMGLHNLNMVSGQVVADIARNESFQGITGKHVTSAPGEPVLRDSKGIIASIFQGPDKRTAATIANLKPTDRLCVLVIGYPSLPADDLRLGATIASHTLRALGAQSIQDWILHER